MRETLPEVNVYSPTRSAATPVREPRSSVRPVCEKREGPPTLMSAPGPKLCAGSTPVAIAEASESPARARARSTRFAVKIGNATRYGSVLCSG